MTKSVRTASQKKKSSRNTWQLSTRERERNPSRPEQDVPQGDTAVCELTERLQAEREQLFKAIGIVELCRLSSATLLDPSDSEYMTPVLETTCDLLNTSAEQLEWIATDLRKLSRKHEP